MQLLKDYIQSQINIDEHDLETIVSCFKVRAVAKNKFVLKQGQIATDYFFVQSGSLRIYFNHGDKLITGWVALENDFFTELESMRNQTPSRFNIQAMEDTILLTIKHQVMEQLYSQFPKWQQFGRQLWEKAFLKVTEGYINFQTMTAEERYLTTMQQSDLLQRVPLKDLSSFLGITPNSLSRIRKNIK